MSGKGKQPDREGDSAISKDEYDREGDSATSEDEYDSEGDSATSEDEYMEWMEGMGQEEQKYELVKEMLSGAKQKQEDIRQRLVQWQAWLRMHASEEAEHYDSTRDQAEFIDLSKKLSNIQRQLKQAASIPTEETLGHVAERRQGDIEKRGALQERKRYWSTREKRFKARLRKLDDNIAEARHRLEERRKEWASLPTQGKGSDEPTEHGSDSLPL